MEQITNNSDKPVYVVTAGSSYLDIDAYACAVALSELLNLKGERAIAYSDAPCNYSVCDFLIRENQIHNTLPFYLTKSSLEYIIVDVSDPRYLSDSVPLERVVGVYDHHTGYEAYWRSRLGGNARIEFIGAAATLIWQEWVKAGMEERMSRSTALLLIAAILDNTLDLTSEIVTPADREAFEALCKSQGIGDSWRAYYFSTVQDSVEDDLKNAILNDVKIIHDHPVLPKSFAQLCVWDSQRILGRLDEIRSWFEPYTENWMMNIIDISRRKSCFVCDDVIRQNELSKIFGVSFQNGVAVSEKAFLRKEIIKAIDSYLKKQG